MEVLSHTSERVSIFLSGLEYLATLRPGGLLARVVEKFPNYSDLIEVDLLQEGAVLKIPSDCAKALFEATPTHACDDRLRWIMAHFFSKVLGG